MKRPWISRLRWDIAVLLALTLSVILEQSWVGPQRLQVAAIQAELSGAQRSRLNQEPATRPDPGAASTQVDHFLETMSGEHYEPDWLVFIHALASGQQLQSGETQYERRVLASLGIVEYVVRLPLTGTFDQFHRFVIELSSRLQLLSINRIQVAPSRRQAGSLDVQLRLSVPIKDPSNNLAQAMERP